MGCPGRAGELGCSASEGNLVVSVKVLALDLERTLIDDALSAHPRPGLRDFLAFCDESFTRVAIYTTVEEADAREVIEDLAREGHLTAGSAGAAGIHRLVGRAQGSWVCTRRRRGRGCARR